MQEQEQSPSILPTVGEIARANQVPIHRVEYAIKSLGIQPVARC